MQKDNKNIFTARECCYLLSSLTHGFNLDVNTRRIDDHLAFMSEDIAIQNSIVLHGFAQGTLSENDIELLKEDCKRNLIPENSFDWVKKHDRTMLLLINELINRKISFYSFVGGERQKTDITIKDEVEDLTNRELNQRIFLCYDLKLRGNIEDKIKLTNQIRKNINDAFNHAASYLVVPE